MMPKGYAVAPLIDRVMSKIVRVPESGCWLFTGATNENGYGVVGRGGRGAGNEKAHRVTYRHFCGEIPDGLFVCHHCDVPSCCNPDHLFLGTNQDNMRDCFAKGRGSKPPANPHVIGEAHPGHKLIEADIVSIRRLHASGRTLAYISERFDVSDSTILRIVRRQSWKHVA